MTEFIKQCAQQVSIQIFAMVLYVQSKFYNHTPKFCKKFFEDLKLNTELMQQGIMGGKYDTLDCVKYCKDELGIDLEKEITTKCEYREGKE